MAAGVENVGVVKVGSSVATPLERTIEDALEVGSVVLSVDEDAPTGMVEVITEFEPDTEVVMSEMMGAAVLTVVAATLVERLKFMDRVTRVVAVPWITVGKVSNPWGAGAATALTASKNRAARFEDDTNIMCEVRRD